MSYPRDAISLLHPSPTMLRVLLTTVDYVLMDVDAASIMSSCVVHEETCLNTSDHLPISVKLDIPIDFVENSNNSTRIDWTKAELSGATFSSQAAVSEIVSPFISSMHNSTDSINDEIQLVTRHSITYSRCCQTTLPCVKPKK